MIRNEIRLENNNLMNLFFATCACFLVFQGERIGNSFEQIRVAARGVPCMVLYGPPFRRMDNIIVSAHAIIRLLNGTVLLIQSLIYQLIDY